MSDTPNKFYLTTPIYYVNARPHIGHAYTTIAADVIARRHRLLGDDTFFLTGTDEHGQKIERSAAAAGIPPQQFADEVSASFRALWQRMGILDDPFSQNDPLFHRDYIRTTDAHHKRGVQKLWKTLADKGAIYLSTYTGQYSVGEEMFIDGPPGTIGPDGKPTETVTEENYFFRLSNYQKQLIDLIESDNPDSLLRIQPESRRNEVLSFLYGDFREIINEYRQLETPRSTEPGADGIPPAGPDSLGAFEWAVSTGRARKSTKGYYIPGALKDLSISRSSFKWGIPVPGDEKHVIYVWLDALANYMTAIGYGSEDPEEKKKFDYYWPADLHLVGKEIIRFHCVYWPAFLMAAGLSLPKAITAHGWLLFEDSKMSKSRGNIVRTETILDAFGNLVYATIFPNSTHHEQDLFAADVLRYFLLREISFGQDGSFSFDALVQRYNSDLANGYGNLVSRTLSMIAKRDGVITEDKIAALDPNFMANDVLSYSAINQTITEVETELEELAFASAIAKILSLIAMADGYMTQYKPWKLVSSPDAVDQYKAEFILGSVARLIRIITALLYPVMPYATAKVWTQLGLGDIEQAAKNGELKNLQWGGLKPGTKLGPLSPIFPRAPKELIQLMNDMEASNAQKPEGLKSVEPSKSVVKNAGLPLINNNNDAGPHHRTEFAESPISSVSATAALNPIAETLHPITAHHPDDTDPRPETPQITIDDFVKIDLRVAQVVVAERIPKADKLLRLEVDLGYERRQILSGIAQWYPPEELIGRRIVVIANLAPRKMRGLESHGMLLAASHGDDGKPVLATFGEDIALGSRLK